MQDAVVEARKAPRSTVATGWTTVVEDNDDDVDIDVGDDDDVVDRGNDFWIGILGVE